MLPSRLAIFPLSSHILPSGRLPLRIFEQRYIRMITECSQNKVGFGIVMFDSTNQTIFGAISPIGTYVKIIDFYTLEDGFLGLIVEGISRFKIMDISIESDGLKMAQVESLPNWPEFPLSNKYQHLTDKLANIFEEYPELDELYAETKDMQNSSWIAQRWLELLPISVGQKQKLINHKNCNITLAVLTKLMNY